ncbi:MAG: CRTAC1 family protein [Aureliella sp.]
MVHRKSPGTLMNRRAIVLPTLILSLVFIDSRAVGAEPGIRFRDVTEQTGIDFVHSDGATGKRYIYEYVSSGMAALDYDGDGLEDLYFLSGGEPGTASASNRLYRNLGNFQFVDVTVSSGLGGTSHSLGVAIGDFDNDGNPDVFVNNFGSNKLYCNLGDGTFQEQPSPAIETANAVGAGTCFADIDGDGDLDIFVANYVEFDVKTHPARVFRGARIYPSPQDFQPAPDQLIENLGDGKFADISEASRVGSYAGTGMGAICGDFDNDGDADIFVCNDVMENFLYENDGTGKFTEVGLLAGVALDFAGTRQGSMGVDTADLNGDGHMDLLVTSYQDETPVIYGGDGQGFFDDITPEMGGLSEAAPHVTWGVVADDFDGDADIDVFMASGHLMDNVSRTDDSQTYAAPNLIYANDGDKLVYASSLTQQLGSPAKVSRGAIVSDLDGDGDGDIVVLNSRESPTVLENLSGGSEWLTVRVIGTRGNRSAIGAAVTVVSSSGSSTKVVTSGRGYQSDFGSLLRFPVKSASSASVKVQFGQGEPLTIQQTGPASVTAIQP